MDKQAREILMAARVRAMNVRPYFTQALCAITLVEKPGIGTMACDKHWRVYYDPTVVKKWGVADSTVGLLHEISHLLQRHHLRAKALGLGPAEHRKANIAQDCAINCMLLQDTDKTGSTPLRLLDTDPVPRAYKLKDGLTWEEYYALLPDMPPSPAGGRGGNCGSGATGVPADWEDAPPGDAGDAEGGGLNSAEVEAIIGSTAAAVKQHVSSKGRGSVPSDWERWAGTVTEAPQVPWTAILARVVRSAIRFVSGSSDYTYSRPSRRGASTPSILMPSMRRPIVNVTGIVDTSASMGDHDTHAALVEVQAICGHLGTPMRVLSVDAKVHTDQLVTAAKQLKLKGGGGTSMNAGIAHVVKTRKQHPVDILVVFTDGGTDFPVRADVPRDLHLIFVLIGDYAESAKQHVPSWAQAVVVKAVEAKGRAA